MTTTTASSNYGTLLKKGSTVIGEIVTIDPPELINEAVEATSHSSGGWREFIPGGLKEVGEFSATVNFAANATVSGITTDLIAGTISSYTFEFPQGSNWTFSGFVVGFKPESADAQSPEALTAEVKFRPTGQPTLA